MNYESTVDMPWSIEWKILSRVRSKAVSVELYLWYADWKVLKLVDEIIWSWTRASSSRSKILEMLFRLEIGMQFDVASLSRPSFLISGETSASLNLDGKVPSEKERLAMVEMNSEKTEEQDFISEVGIKSWRVSI